MELLPECLSLIQHLNMAECWGLSPEDCCSTAQAVLPWAIAAQTQDEAVITQIVKNYYLDGQVVEALRDPERFTDGAELASQWRSFMLAVVRNRFSIDADLAEDIVQDSWIDLLHALHDYRFHFRSRFKTFLYSLTIYRGLNTLRQEHTHRWDAQPALETVIETSSPPPMADAAPYPGQKDWINGELTDLVNKAIQQYCATLRQGQIAPEIKKQLAQLVLLEDQSLQAAADRLHLNYNAAMTIVRRIRLYLQQLPELREYNE
jgi:RNA polymerase sigma factor (sigma-70 family)